MEYPKNKTQLIKFLRENPDLHYKVTNSVRGVQMRRLKKAQTNGFCGTASDGRQIWFWYSKDCTYAFDGAIFCVTVPGVQLSFDFNPTADEIQAYEEELARSKEAA